MSMGHFLHFLIPRIVQLGLNLLSNGSFALQSKAFRLFGCLKATIGGLGNISNIFLSLVSVLQCFVKMFEILGSLGLNVITKMTLSLGFLMTFFKASSLVMPFAFVIAAFFCKFTLHYNFRFLIAVSIS